MRLEFKSQSDPGLLSKRVEVSNNVWSGESVADQWLQFPESADQWLQFRGESESLGPEYVTLFKHNSYRQTENWDEGRQLRFYS